MKRLKKLLISLSTIAIFVSNYSLVRAAETTIKNEVPYVIDDWKLDEANHYLYAVASDLYKRPSRILFLDQDDLTVKANIALKTGGEFEFANGKVFIVGDEENSITMVDVATKSIEKTFITQKKPAHITIDANKLFYVDNTYDPYHTIPKLYVIDITSGTEKAVPIPIALGNSGSYFSWVDIDVNPINHVLYMGEVFNPSRHGKAGIQAISSVDYRVLDNYLSYDPEFFKEAENIIADGSDVFYAGYRFDANNLKNVYGSYANKSIRNVMGDFVFTSNEIYDRKSFEKLKDLEQSPYEVIDSKEYVYFKKSGPMQATQLEKFRLDIKESQTIHAVQLGDTLWKISRNYGTTISAIAKINGLDIEKPLTVRQQLIIPEGGEISRTPVSMVNLPIHVVAPGESLWKIAKIYNITLKDLVVINGKDPSKELWIGEKLTIPLYKVREGNYVWQIAKEFNMTISELVELNGLQDANMIKVGQSLKVMLRK